MPVIGKNIRRERFVADARLNVRAKTGDGAATDPGSLEGYLAVYGVIDLSGEVIRAGCFAKSLAAKLAAGGLPLMTKHFAHGGDAAECIGTITKAHDDARGLMIDDAPFSDDADAQKIRQRIVGKHVRGLSVGFYTGSYEVRPPKDDNEKAILARVCRSEVIEWVECEIAEGTVTCRPCNEQAEITGAKSRAEAALNLKRDVENRGRILRLVQL